MYIYICIYIFLYIYLYIHTSVCGYMLMQIHVHTGRDGDIPAQTTPQNRKQSRTADAFSSDGKPTQLCDFDICKRRGGGDLPTITSPMRSHIQFPSGKSRRREEVAINGNQTIAGLARMLVT